MEYLAAYTRANSANLLHQSDVPEICKTAPCSLGIDEAGRGPVLGPMVYACAYCPVDKTDDLKAIGVDDSKALTEEQREKMFAGIVGNSDFVGWAVHILAPQYISTSMYKRGKYNLNSMSHDTAIGLIRAALDSGVRVHKVFVDTVGPPEKYQAKLQGVFPDLEITVAKKADSLFPSVSAASICAKVARDKALKDWEFAESTAGGKSFPQTWGSGYPGDPATKKFLLSTIDPFFGFPSIVRFSWKTAEKLIDEKCVKMLFEEVEPAEDESVKKNPSVKDFFIQAPKKETARSKSRGHPYFTERGLSRVGSAALL